MGNQSCNINTVTLGVDGISRGDSSTAQIYYNNKWMHLASDISHLQSNATNFCRMSQFRGLFKTLGKCTLHTTTCRPGPYLPWTTKQAALSTAQKYMWRMQALLYIGAREREQIFSHHNLLYSHVDHWSLIIVQSILEAISCCMQPHQPSVWAYALANVSQPTYQCAKRHRQKIGNLWEEDRETTKKERRGMRSQNVESYK